MYWRSSLYKKMKGKCNGLFYSTISGPFYPITNGPFYPTVEWPFLPDPNIASLGVSGGKYGDLVRRAQGIIDQIKQRQQDVEHEHD